MHCGDIGKYVARLCNLALAGLCTLDAKTAWAEPRSRTVRNIDDWIPIT